jgi:hypothetical protein
MERMHESEKWKKVTKYVFLIEKNHIKFAELHYYYK